MLIFGEAADAKNEFIQTYFSRFLPGFMTLGRTVSLYSEFNQNFLHCRF